MPNSDVIQLTQTGAQVQADLDLTENLQDAFSESATYAVDDLVIYNAKLWKCHTAVASAGVWTGSTNWTEIKLSDLRGASGGTQLYKHEFSWINSQYGQTISCRGFKNESGTLTSTSLNVGFSSITIISTQQEALSANVDYNTFRSFQNSIVVNDRSVYFTYDNDHDHKIQINPYLQITTEGFILSYSDPIIVNSWTDTVTSF